MALQMICDICGGKLVMRAGGVAVCENCTMEYSLESLREKAGAPQAAASQAPVLNDGAARIRNKLAQAQSFLEERKYLKVIECCEAVHDIDCTNQEAWRIITQARICYYSRNGAQNLAGVRKHITDEAVWNALVDAVRPILLQQTVNEDTLKNFEGLLDVEKQLALDCLYAALENLTAQLQEKGREIRELFAKEKSSRPDGYSSSNASMITTNYAFQEYMKTIVAALGHLEKLIAFCEEKKILADDRFDQPLQVIQTFLDDASGFQTWSGDRNSRSHTYTHRLEPFLKGPTYYDARNYEQACKRMKTVRQPIEKRNEEILRQKKAAELEAQKKRQEEKKAAIARYWEEHAEEKASLTKQKADIQAEIVKRKQENLALNNDNKGKELQNQIHSLQREHDSLGLFKGKQKQAILEQINGIRYELTKWENTCAAARKENGARIKTLTFQLEQVEKSLANPKI